MENSMFNIDWTVSQQNHLFVEPELTGRIGYFASIYGNNYNGRARAINIEPNGETAIGKIVFGETPIHYTLVSKRPSQETLDELYDLFGWYYVDI